MQVIHVRRRFVGIALALALFSVGSFAGTATAYAPTYPDGRYCPLVIGEAGYQRYWEQYEYRRYPNGYYTQVWGHYQLQMLIYSPWGGFNWASINSYQERLCAAWYG